MRMNVFIDIRRKCLPLLMTGFVILLKWLQSHQFTNVMWRDTNYFSIYSIDREDIFGFGAFYNVAWIFMHTKESDDMKRTVQRTHVKRKRGWVSWWWIQCMQVSKWNANTWIRNSIYIQVGMSLVVCKCWENEDEEVLKSCCIENHSLLWWLNTWPLNLSGRNSWNRRIILIS